MCTARTASPSECRMNGLSAEGDPTSGLQHRTDTVDSKRDGMQISERAFDWVALKKTRPCPVGVQLANGQSGDIHRMERRSIQVRLQLNRDFSSLCEGLSEFIG